MKININTYDLQSVLKKVEKLKYKSNIEAQKSILIKTLDNAISLIAYNTYVQMEAEIKATVIEKGEILLPHSLIKTIDSIDYPEITITDNNISYNDNKIQFAPVDYKLITINTQCQQNLFNIKENELYQHLKNVSYATAKDVVRPVLTTVNVHRNNFCAVNSYTLALSKTNNFDIDESINLPLNLVELLLKLCNKNKDNQVSVSINKDHKYIEFIFNSFKIVSELMEGKFFEYKSIISDRGKSKTIIELNAADLFKKLKTICDLKSLENSEKVKLIINMNSLLIENKTQLKYAKVIVPIKTIKYDQQFVIALNPYFLKEPLKKYSSNDIEMNFDSPTSPIIIRPVDSDNDLDFILPMRIKE